MRLLVSATTFTAAWRDAPHFTDAEGAALTEVVLI